MARTGFAKAVSAVAFLTMVSKVLGFLRETAMASTFGATFETDAYLLAQTIPFLLFGTISYAVATTFIPVYSHVREGQGTDAGFRFASTVIWVLLSLSCILVLVGELMAGSLVMLVAPGADPGTQALTTYLSRILLPIMTFQLLSGVITGVLQAHGNFAVPTLAGLAQNISIIVSIVMFGRRFGISAVAAGTLIGGMLATGVMVPSLYQTGFRMRRMRGLRDAGIRRMFALMVPAIVTAGANEINTLVDRTLASSLAEGSVAALNYATKLMQLAPTVLGASIVTVTYPALARMAARKEWQLLSNSLISALRLIHFILAPIAVGVIVLRLPLVRIAFERGAFDAQASEATAWALLFLGLSISVSTMRNLVSRAFFTLQDTKTPMVVGVLTVAANIVLNLLLVGPLHHGGLALANSLAVAFGLIIALWALRKKADLTFSLGRLARSLLSPTVASLIMGVIVGVAYKYTGTVLHGRETLVEILRVTVSAMVGVTVYLSISWWLKVPELREMWLMLDRTVKARRRDRTQR